MATIVVFLRDASGNPVTGASPTFDYWDTTSPGAPQATGQAMTELVGGIGGAYFATVATTDGREYVYEVDGTASSTPRYQGGVFSGETDARIETDIPAILVDTDTTIPALIAALNDLSIADVQTALTNQGYTAARAPNLDNLDAAISAVTAAIAALNDLSQADVQAALTAQGYTAARAPNLDNLDAAVSSRSTFDETTDPVELLDSGGTAGTSAAELVVDIEANLSAAHGAGQWDAVSAGLTQQQVRDAMKLAPTAGAPAGGSVDEHLDDILADTAAIDARLPADPADESNQLAQHTATQAAIAALNDLSIADVQTALTNQGYTAARASNLDNLDAAVSSRSSHSAADVDTTLTGSHGAGSWATATGFSTHSAADAADAVWDEDIVVAHGTGDTAGLLLRALGALISQRANNPTLHALLNIPDSPGSFLAAAVDTELSANHGAGLWDATASIPAIVSGVWGEALPGAFGAGTAGFILGTNLDTTVSSRSSHTAADVDTVLSGSHGAGSWLTATGFSTHSAGDVWDELTAAHVGVGSFGLLIGTNLDVTVSSRSTLVQADILSDATPFPGANIDVAISSRSSHSAADVDTTLTASHGAGSWQTATGFSVPGDAMTLTAGERTAVATEIWSTDISANSNKLTEAGGMLNLVRKVATNRHRLTPGASSGTFEIFDDNDVSVILQHVVNDATGGGVASPLLSPARRARTTV